MVKRLGDSIKKYDVSLVSLKNKIETFNKKNPSAKYSTVYLRLFSKVYFDYCLRILQYKQAFGSNYDFNKEKILQYCLLYYDDYFKVMNKEFNKIKI